MNALTSLSRSFSLCIDSTSQLSRGQAFFAFDYRVLARVRKDVGGSIVLWRLVRFVRTATSERRREGEQGTGREEAPAKRSKLEDSDETFFPRLPFEVIDYIEWGFRARQALL